MILFDQILFYRRVPYAKSDNFVVLLECKFDEQGRGMVNGNLTMLS